MVFAAGALSAGIGALSALLSPDTKSKTGVSAGTSFDVGVSGPSTQNKSGLPAQTLSPSTFSAALSAQSGVSASSSDKASALQRLFGALDTDGNGGISKAEFEQQLGAGGTNIANADKVFGKIDTNGDGSISIDELTSALSAGKKKHAHHAGQGGNQDPLLKALDGASSSSSTNSDGATVTTLTYADGTKVTLTKPASVSASASAASSYNFVERAIEQQAKYLGTSSSASVSVSA